MQYFHEERWPHCRHKIYHKKGTQAQQTALSSDGQFTVAPFISAKGEPVCCVVVFQSKEPEPKLEWGKGWDIKVKQL